LRIPEVFWKILFDPVEERALAFIVFNSPCPWNTVLLNGLNMESSGCSKDYCTTVVKKFGLKNPWNANTEYDVRGLVFCCETVFAAIGILESDAKSNKILNELKLLPENVRGAKPLISKGTQNNRLHGSGR
jgi:hypothetical protein